MQEALTQLGGSPLEHRTDSLSAAYKNLSAEAQADSTSRYESLCAHYSMRGTRNNKGVAHENGAVESSHGHLKRRIEQALLLRGSADFESIEAYRVFIHEVVRQHNRRNAKGIALERQALQALPAVTATDYTELRAVVSSSSTIDVRKVTYTVPSRLQGETLLVRLYDDRLVCYLGSQHVIKLSRVYPLHKTRRARQVDYRHVIHALVKKPQAFRYSCLRDDLLPSAGYKTIWSHVNETLQPTQACKFIVGLLHLAAQANCEAALESKVLQQIEGQQRLSLVALQAAFNPPSRLHHEEEVTQHGLAHYNQFIPAQVEEVAHV